MNPANGSSAIKKQEDLEPTSDQKPSKSAARTLNRVPSASLYFLSQVPFDQC
jgi:hypothetical protein